MRPPDEVKRDLVHQWLVKAENDLAAARLLIFQEQSFYFIVGFHCQQATEKYVKALLTLHQVEFPRTHDMDRLLDLLAVVQADLAANLRPAADLNSFGVEYRYPQEHPDPSRLQAEEMLALAERVREEILPLLPNFPAT